MTTDTTSTTAKVTDPVTLKQAAEHCQCAASTLKRMVKEGKLHGTNAHPKAPYMVKLEEVEQLLRDTPGIASKFHPKTKKQGELPLDVLETQPSTSCSGQSTQAAPESPSATETTNSSQTSESSGAEERADSETSNDQSIVKHHGGAQRKRKRGKGKNKHEFHQESTSAKATGPACCMFAVMMPQHGVDLGKFLLNAMTQVLNPQSSAVKKIINVSP